MNTIYRIVWNATTSKWVVASELAKGRTKKSSSKLLSALVVVAAFGGMGMAHNASAQVLIGTGASNGENTNNTVIGNGAQGTAS
jgi:hypothetical protein